MTRLPKQRREVDGQALLFDDDTTDRVLRDAHDPGYLLLGVSESVHTRHIGTRAAEHAIPVRPDVATTVHQLIAAGRLVHGSRISVTVNGRAEPEPAVTVDVASTATGEAAEGPVQVFVDVVRPGHGLVTADAFTGQIVRDGGTYLVETDTGHVIGRARSFRAGAERLARHHGLRADSVEIDHEHKDYAR